MAIILGGVLLPKYTQLKKLNDANQTDSQTLGGGIYTDFINVRRGWKIIWNLLKEEDYTTIRAIYDNQFTTGAYPVLQFDAENIYTPAKMDIPTEEDIKYNGAYIENFNIVLKEQPAIS